MKHVSIVAALLVLLFTSSCATKGQTVSYEAPTGKTIEVTVLDFEVYTG